MISEPPAADFFWDSYALLERQRGNPAYERFRNVPIITHQWNLFEFAYSVARKDSESQARVQLAALNPNVLDADTDDILAAVRFRLQHRANGISYVDALGFTLAKRHGKRFLTGDDAFEHLPGVAFVR